MAIKRPFYFGIVLLTMLGMGCGEAGNSTRSGPDTKASPQGSPLTSASVVTTPVGNTGPINQPIAIVAPANGAQVIYREIIRGTVADPKAKVWVIVRPMSQSDYWVQPPVDLGNDAAWSVQAYIGQSETSNIGDHFKIVAVANPVKNLKEGDKLVGWPDAKWQSQVIEVTRK